MREMLRWASAQPWGTHIFMERKNLQFNSTYHYLSAYYVPGALFDMGIRGAKDSHTLALMEHVVKTLLTYSGHLRHGRESTHFYLNIIVQW